jgi:hypothetical protein
MISSISLWMNRVGLVIAGSGILHPKQAFG